MSAARAPAPASSAQHPSTDRQRGAAPQHRQTARRSTPAQRGAPQADSGALHAKKLYVHVTRELISPNVFNSPSINVNAHLFGAMGRPEPAALTTSNPRSHPDVCITRHFHLPQTSPHTRHMRTRIPSARLAAGEPGKHSIEPQPTWPSPSAHRSLILRKKLLFWLVLSSSTVRYRYQVLVPGTAHPCARAWSRVPRAGTPRKDPTGAAPRGYRSRTRAVAGRGAREQTADGCATGTKNRDGF